MPVLDSIATLIRRRGSNLATTEQYPRQYWPTRTGITAISDDLALSLTAVYRCVVLLSSTAAGLPLHVYQEDSDGQAQRIKPQTLRFLWDRPNPEMTKQTFWEAVLGHEVMGDAFIFVVKNADDAPLQVWYIEPWRVAVGRTSPDSNGNRRKVYKIDGERSSALIDYMDGGEIIHVPNWSRESLRGVSPIRAAGGALSLAISGEDVANRFFSEDSVPRGILRTPANLSQQEADDIMALWEQRNANRRRTALLAGGLEYQTVAISPEDAQLLEQRHFQLGEIARLFGVPPHMIGDTERSTSWGTGILEQTQGFLAYTLQPHINRFEQAINDALLRRGDTNRYVKFELGGLLRPNLVQRYQAYSMSYARFQTANEIRALEELPPIEGGDELLAPLNLAAAEQVVGLGGAPPAQTNTPGPPEERAFSVNGSGNGRTDGH